MVCLIGFLVISWLGWGQFYATVRSAVPVKAVILIAGRVSETAKSGGGETQLLYEYEYESVRYQGSQSTFGSVWMGHSASSDLQMQTEVDQLSRLIEQRRMASLKDPTATQQKIEVQVWLDPKNPNDSALLNRVHPALTGITAFICLALLVGIIRPFVESKNSRV
jgi:hypothetical protein